MKIFNNILIFTAAATLVRTEAQGCGDSLCVNLCCPKGQLLGDAGVNKCDTAPAVNGKRCIDGDPQQVKLPRPNNKINQNQTSIVIN